LMEWNRELIPETERRISKGAITVIRKKEDDVGGRETVTRDEERVLGEYHSDAGTSNILFADLRTI